MSMNPPPRLSSGENRQRNPHDGGRFVNPVAVGVTVAVLVGMAAMAVGAGCSAPRYSPKKHRNSARNT